MASKIPSISSREYLNDRKYCLDTEYVFVAAQKHGMIQETYTPLPENEVNHSIPPFSLLTGNGGLKRIQDEIIRQYPNFKNIADAYPCTPLQEGLMALSLKQDGKFMPQIICKLPADIDLDLFKTAWQSTVDSNTTLRTTLIQTELQGLIQVVHKSVSIKWELGEDLDHYLSNDRRITPEFGSALMRYGILDERKVRRKYFIWTFHHALIDGWAMRLLLKQVDQHYKREKVAKLVDFNKFIAFSMETNKHFRLENETFWFRHLEDSKPSAFPAIPSTSYIPLSQSSLQRQIKVPHNLKIIATTSTIIQAAWALLISRYTNSVEATFGLVLSGRTTLIPDIQKINGPTFTTVPMRVKTPNSASVNELFSSVHKSRVSMKPYQHFGIQNISKLSPNAATACSFQNLLVIQPQLEDVHDSLFTSRKNADDHWSRLNAYALMMQCNLTQDGFDIMATFDSRLFCNEEMEKILGQFESIIMQFSVSPDSLLDSITITTLDVAGNITAVYDSGAEESPTCVHDMVQKSSQKFFSDIAIDSWDGKTTYEDLQLMSDQLAHRLRDLKIGPEIMVPLVFERSLWMVVAIMAVMKSGGTFVPLNPDHPRKRIEGMVRQVEASILLCSERFAKSLSGITNETLAVGPATLSQLPISEGRIDALLRPDNAVYVIFTSGSTGNPKGCVIEHKTCCSTLKQMSKFFGMSSKSRFLQISSYTFDGCILEILATLIVGGTVCIPSEGDKMDDIATAINKMQVNIAFMTPSYSRLINPSAVPTLESLAIGGEKVLQEDLDRWTGKLRLFNVYGPTECCVICISQVVSKGISPSKIGKGFIGGHIVLDDAGQLATPGVVGELLIGGPNLARGYLNEPEKTAASFVGTPSNISHLNLGYKKWYKTGDMVKYDTDGSLQFVGRKDSQGKLAGQRIEMGEVEYHLRKNLEGVVDLVSIIATPEDSSESAFLAAFISFKDKFYNHESNTTPPSSTLLDSKPLMDSTIATLSQALSASLPRYMIPKIYIRLNKMPLNSSGKIDRQLLEKFAAGFTKDQFMTYSGKQIECSAPVTEREHQIQHLWSKILNADPYLIGRNDSFIRLGGDSILAMKLVAAARNQGISLTVAKVFQTPVLSDLAQSSLDSLHTINHLDNEAPNSSHPGGFDVGSSVYDDLHQYYGIRRNEIEDLYPCTPFQKGIMAVSLSQPGAYIAQHVFELPPSLASDPDQFLAAWSRVIDSKLNSILRTRIVHVQSMGLIQVVVKDLSLCKEQEALDRYLEADRACPMELGAPLHRLAFLKPTAQDDKFYFVWTAHHATYDAWSLMLTIKQVEEEYEKLKADLGSHPRTICAPLSKTSNSQYIPFTEFVRDVQILDQVVANNFWHAQLSHGEEPSHFPTVKSSYAPKPTEVLTHEIHFVRKSKSDIRTSDLIQTAWSITVSNYANTNDIVFGTIMSGRTGSMANVASVMGPTITTVPIRHKIDFKTSAQKLLRSFRDQMIEIMPFEQFGLSNIQQINSKCRNAVDFQNLLVIQPKENSDIDQCFLGSRKKTASTTQALDTYALTMECSLNSDGIRAKAIFDPKVIDPIQMNRIVLHFKHVLQQLCIEAENKTIEEINSISSADCQEIWEWNNTLPEPTEACVHDLIKDMMYRSPEAQAVSSWDGDLTRRELDSFSSRLALHLVQQGVGSQTIVPILFDKSKWAIVSVLAIIKAGGSFLPCDPLQPRSRLISILEQVQVNMKVIICSAEHAEFCSLLAATTPKLVVNESLLARLPEQIDHASYGPSPDDALYVIFTSGTTGVPKGIVVDHKAYCSGAKFHAEPLGFTQKSRLLQFASYSFDTSVEDILTTLLTGGCICVPSEDERTSDIQGAIHRMNVNAADLTASYISTINPHDVPSLERLTVGGEPATPNVIKTWADKLHLINAYGATECCVTSIINSDISTGTDSANIGRAVGAVSWIVDATNSDRLVPIGVTGELLIEGPALARGYLNDKEKTDLAFICTPAWANRDGSQSRPARLYKTGDLVRYNGDGTINYIGRKDTQIHMAGRRIELSDIESHLLCHPEIKNAMVARPTQGPYRDSLTALVELDISVKSTGSQCREIEILRDTDLDELGFDWTKISDHLSNRLPSYMLPSIWIAIASMPLQISGKLDRPKLSTWLSSHPTNNRLKRNTTSNTSTPMVLNDPIAIGISSKVADLVSGGASGVLPSSSRGDIQLSAAGIDSIRMMTLASFIKKSYNVSVPFPLLINHETKLTDVAKYVHEVRRGMSRELTTQLDLIAEYLPLNDKLSLLQKDLGVVFMTGATGFLGTQILRQLLSNSCVGKVIAHVRGDDFQTGRQRIITAAKASRWWSDDFNTRLDVWVGDLAQPMLGLDSTKWSYLQKVDAIIHNGASVKWSTDYHNLKSANVGSTFELLAAVAGSRPNPKFIYISGGRSFDEEMDDVLTAKKLATVDGYSQTKFVAELLVRDFGRRAIASGQTGQVSIIKPGLIIGTKLEGMANTRDFLWRYVAGAVRIGAYPRPNLDDWLVVSSVDRVADTAIMALQIDSSTVKDTFSIIDGVLMHDFWNIVNSRLGENLRVVSPEDWMKMISVDIEAEAESHPLWPVAHMLDPKGNLGKSRKPIDVDDSVIIEVKDAIGKNVNYLREIGFLKIRGS